MIRTKPIVLFVNKDGKVELSQDELQKMIEDAYEEGKKDGKANGVTITSPWIVSPTYTNPYYKTWEITCSDTSTASNPVSYTTCTCNAK